MPAAQRSVLPSLPGIPWWGAILVAVTATAIGFAFDAGSGTKGLSTAFGVCYVTGCILAVLAVRQSGVFTTVIQPPLILFAAVPGAYFLFHGDEIKGIKDILINCGYPLIERFPLMFFTAITVLVIGVARWYLGHSAGRRTAVEADPDTTRSARRNAVADSAAETAAEQPVRRSRRRAAEAPESDDEADEPRTARRSRAAAARPRRDRAPETEVIPSVTDRPRRSRPPADGDEPRRRSRDEVRERRASTTSAERRSATSAERRSSAASERRSANPSERRSSERRSAAPSERRSQDRRDRPQRGDADRPVRRERLDRTDRPERAERPDRYDRPERRRRAAEYEPFETFDRYEPDAGRSGNGSHHPVSRVRYRGADDGESRVEQRSTPRRQRSAGADAWEYDV